MKSVLLVQSNYFEITQLTALLTLANYDVIIARCGKEGVELAQKLQPGLVIGNTSLSNLDGWSMLHMLRHDTRTEAIPVILLSSDAANADFRKAMDSGADDFLAMPCTNDELLRSIEYRFRRICAIKKATTALSSTATCSPAMQEALASPSPDNQNLYIYQKKNMFSQEVPDRHFLYFICNSEIKITRVYEDGKQLVIGLYENDRFLGHAALLTHATYRNLERSMQERTENVIS